MPRKAFYAWQSDSDESTNRHFIADALKRSIADLNADLDIEESDGELAFDRDTQGEPGMPAVADTVLRKISEAEIFVGDLTLVATIDRDPRKPKHLPNANVSIEFGFAAGTIGFERIVCVFNDACGVDPENLPFDLVHRQHPIRYHLAPKASDAQRNTAMDGLVEKLVDALRVIVTRLGLGPTVDPLAHAAVPLDHFSFTGDSPLIAHAKSRGADGVENEHVFWYNNPLAWFRLVPSADMSLSRAQLRALLAAAKPSLQPFGDPPRSQLVYNERGAIVVGYEEFLPTEAMEITQLFRTGEIFGMNRRLIEPERTKPAPTYLIRWPTIKVQFQTIFDHYVTFARDVLQAPLPLTVVVGLASVYDARFTRQKENWFSDASAESRCLKGNIAWRFQIGLWSEADARLLEPFFAEILDECNQG